MSTSLLLEKSILSTRKNVDIDSEVSHSGVIDNLSSRDLVTRTKIDTKDTWVSQNQHATMSLRSRTEA